MRPRRPARSTWLQHPLRITSKTFLGFPSAPAVPLGSYNRSVALVAQDNGRVLKICRSPTAWPTDPGRWAIDNGAALGITDGERQQLRRYTCRAEPVAGPHSALWTISGTANWGIKPPIPRRARPDPNKFTDRDCVSKTALGDRMPESDPGEVLGVVGTPLN